jgi:hypothetical protein
MVTFGTIVAACSDGSTPTQLDRRAAMPSMQQTQNQVDGAEFGFTAGWFQGNTVQFFYHRPFFCRTPVEDGNPVGSTTGCEAGSDGTVDPRPGSIPILFVMTPIGFRPADATLQCPIVGHCINHPRSTCHVCSAPGRRTLLSRLTATSWIRSREIGGSFT